MLYNKQRTHYIMIYNEFLPLFKIILPLTLVVLISMSSQFIKSEIIEVRDFNCQSTKVSKEVAIDIATKDAGGFLGTWVDATLDGNDWIVEANSKSAKPGAVYIINGETGEIIKKSLNTDEYRPVHDGINRLDSKSSSVTFKYPIFRGWVAKSSQIQNGNACVISFSKLETDISNGADLNIVVVTTSKTTDAAFPHMPADVKKNDNNIFYKTRGGNTVFYLDDCTVEIYVEPYDTQDQDFNSEIFFKTVIESFNSTYKN